MLAGSGRMFCLLMMDDDRKVMVPGAYDSASAQRAELAGCRLEFSFARFLQRVHVIFPQALYIQWFTASKISLRCLQINRYQSFLRRLLRHGIRMPHYQVFFFFSRQDPRVKICDPSRSGDGGTESAEPISMAHANHPRPITMTVAVYAVLRFLLLIC